MGKHICPCSIHVTLNNSLSGLIGTYCKLDPKHQALYKDTKHCCEDNKFENVFAKWWPFGSGRKRSTIEAIWFHSSGSILAQLIMAYCLTTPSRYLNQLNVNKDLWHSAETKYSRYHFPKSIWKKNALAKLLPHLPGARELKPFLTSIQSPRRWVMGELTSSDCRRCKFLITFPGNPCESYPVTLVYSCDLWTPFTDMD